jgi:hypothetical protein
MKSKKQTYRVNARVSLDNVLDVAQSLRDMGMDTATYMDGAGIYYLSTTAGRDDITLRAGDTFICE